MVGRVTLGKGEALSPADTRSPGQHLHPGPRGHGHCGQCPPPCPRAEPTALAAGAGQDPDMVRPGSGGSGWEAHQMGTCVSPWQQAVDLRPCVFMGAKLSLSISVHTRPCSCVRTRSCVDVGEHVPTRVTCGMVISPKCLRVGGHIDASRFPGSSPSTDGTDGRVGTR